MGRSRSGNARRAAWQWKSQFQLVSHSTSRCRETVAALSVAGSTVSFEIVIDDYAEIWVNGKLTTVLGQSGGSVVKGWNAPNKVILTRNAQPGEQFEIAVFGYNGPVSRAPAELHLGEIGDTRLL